MVDSRWKSIPGACFPAVSSSCVTAGAGTGAGTEAGPGPARRSAGGGQIFFEAVELVPADADDCRLNLEITDDLVMTPGDVSWGNNIIIHLQMQRSNFFFFTLPVPVAILQLGIAAKPSTNLIPLCTVSNLKSVSGLFLYKVTRGQVLLWDYKLSQWPVVPE